MSERPEEALEWLWAHRKDADAQNYVEVILDYIEDLKDDSKRLDKLLKSGRLRYQLDGKNAVHLSNRRAIDEDIFEHVDEWGNPHDGWWSCLEEPHE